MAEEFGARFSILKFPASKEDEAEIALHKKERDAIKVKADTLSALLSVNKAILYQKERAPFTEKDMELRNAILELYPHDRATPFPAGFNIEPKFEIKEPRERK